MNQLDYKSTVHLLTTLQSFVGHCKGQKKLPTPQNNLSQKIISEWVATLELQIKNNQVDDKDFSLRMVKFLEGCLQLLQ